MMDEYLDRQAAHKAEMAAFDAATWRDMKRSYVEDYLFDDDEGRLRRR